MNLNWSDYHATTGTKTIELPTGGSFTDNIQNDYAGAPVNVSQKPTWDAVNLEFGRHMDWNNDHIRLHGGVQYAHISTQMVYASPYAVNSTTYASETTTYNGFGPRIGLDFSHAWKNNFATYATAAAAILIGPNQFNDTGIGPDSTTWASLSGSTTALVPEIEAKLGVNYTHPLSQGDLTFDLGWMWNTYFNAQQNSAGLVGDSGQGGIQESNFGLQGLYFGVKWKNNLA